MCLFWSNADIWLVLVFVVMIMIMKVARVQSQSRTINLFWFYFIIISYMDLVSDPLINIIGIIHIIIEAKAQFASFNIKFKKFQLFDFLALSQLIMIMAKQKIGTNKDISIYSFFWFKENLLLPIYSSIYLLFFPEGSLLFKQKKLNKLAFIIFAYTLFSHHNQLPLCPKKYSTSTPLNYSNRTLTG